METKTKMIYGGILTLMIALSSGITYFIQDTGSKSSCTTGWQYLEEGKYQCGTRTQTCFEVYDSSNTKNYWCKIGKIVFKNITQETPTTNQEIKSLQYICDKNKCEATQ